MADDPLDLDALMEAQGGAVAERWRQASAKVAAYREKEAARNAELDLLPLSELRDRAVATLALAAAQLQGTEIGDDLKRHGWNRRFADSLAAECRRLRQCVLDGEYERSWGGSGLGRWMLEEVTPMASDSFKEAIHEAQFLLEAYSRRLPE